MAECKEGPLGTVHFTVVWLGFITVRALSLLFWRPAASVRGHEGGSSHVPAAATAMSPHALQGEFSKQHFVLHVSAWFSLEIQAAVLWIQCKWSSTVTCTDKAAELLPYYSSLVCCTASKVSNAWTASSTEPVNIWCSPAEIQQRNKTVVAVTLKHTRSNMINGLFIIKGIFWTSGLCISSTWELCSLWYLPWHL